MQCHSKGNFDQSMKRTSQTSVCVCVCGGGGGVYVCVWSLPPLSLCFLSLSV